MPRVIVRWAIPADLQRHQTVASALSMPPFSEGSRSWHYPGWWTQIRPRYVMV